MRASQLEPLRFHLEHRPHHGAVPAESHTALTAPPGGDVPPSADSSWPPLPLAPSAPGIGGLFRYSLTLRQCSSSWSVLGSCREDTSRSERPAHHGPAQRRHLRLGHLMSPVQSPSIRERTQPPPAHPFDRQDTKALRALSTHPARPPVTTIPPSSTYAMKQPSYHSTAQAAAWPAASQVSGGNEPMCVGVIRQCRPASAPDSSVQQSEHVLWACKEPGTQTQSPP